jgi:gamma-glutamyltranspeptidase
VLGDGQPLLALGWPGGSTVITVVQQILLGPARQAIAAPRASHDGHLGRIGRGDRMPAPPEGSQGYGQLVGHVRARWR